MNSQMTVAAEMASYPDQFYTAASYVGFGGSPSFAARGVASKFSNDATLLLYALYQQEEVCGCCFFICSFQLLLKGAAYGSYGATYANPQAPASVSQSTP